MRDESDECEARFYCVSVEHTFTVSGRDIFFLERSLINCLMFTNNSFLKNYQFVMRNRKKI